ncbi:hypothetical protein C8R45DRAFT_1033270 [Mycena sanguinolenta]|nr:hypothetical protein C8R45DRAFT_1033270 [Mycena sanguinolenta]
MQPETWNGSWYIAAQSLRYTPTTTYASPPGQGYSHVPYLYGDQAYGYGGNYLGMDDQRMHTFPQASGPSRSVLGSTPTPPSRKKKEAHTTAVMNLPAEKQEEWDWIPKGTDTRDPDVLQTAAEKKQMRMLWERERRKWGKAPPPVAGVVPPGAAEFQHSVRANPPPVIPLHIPFTPLSPIKFRKGALMTGITLEDAWLTRTKLFGDDAYTLQDLHADQQGRIHLRVYWPGFSHSTYEIPLSVHDGRVSIEALSRRVARACIGYLLTSTVSLIYSQIVLHRLEEIAYGVWQPILENP